MDIFSFFTMLGGLALFLFGMEMMGNGLKKLSGSKLEMILGRLTSHPLKGVLLGTGVTAIIQSSSATTVMVVGFVNSGIMRLEQAVGVIMGANIGTTVTSWLLSMTGIHSENLLIRLLEPSAFSPLLAFTGIILMMFCKSERKHDIGTIMLGFSILMTGMGSMSDAVAPLAHVPGFTRMMTLFSNPILGMAAGAVLTAIIQSSSASVGILQALCATGTISYSIALPVIMGQNIGTCVTALLSAVNASRNSKRAALIHLYFNLIGTSIFMIVFYSLNVFMNFAFLKQSADAAGIAIIHSSFNIAATIILLPFSKQLVKLACLTLPDIASEEAEKSKVNNSLLDERFLEKPAFALQQAQTVTENVIKDILMLALHVCELPTTYLKGSAKAANDESNRITNQLEQLNEYLMCISNCQLSAKDSYTVKQLFQSISELNGISAHLAHIAEVSKIISKQKHSFSPPARKELRELWSRVDIILKKLDEAFLKGNSITSMWIARQNSLIQEEIKELKKNHIKRLRNGKCSVETGMCFLDLLMDYEQIASHCTNLFDEAFIMNNIEERNS